MSLLVEYGNARHYEKIARLHRVYALRAMVNLGMSQRQISEMLGISQSAVSQQLRSAPNLSQVHPADVLEASAQVLKHVAKESGYERLAVFGSVARGEARQDSDLDFIIDAPEGTSSFAFLRFKSLVEEILGREVDMITYGGLSLSEDNDIRRDAVLL